MKFNWNQPYGYLRILHALPQTNSYDCYLNEKLYAKDLFLEDFTDYQPIAAGEHHLSLCPHKTSEPIHNRSFWIAPGRIYTLLLTYAPSSETIQYYLLNDPPKKIPDEHLLLRVAPFCQLDTPCELHLVDTHPFFKNLKLGQPSPYLSFSPNSYILELLECSTQKTILKQEKCLLKSTRYYTLYLLGGTPDLSLRFVLTIDGNSFLDFPAL